MCKRKKKLEAEIGVFVKQYARRAHAGHDPNDRQYDRRIEALIKRMKPEELDELMNGSDDDEDSPQAVVATADNAASSLRSGRLIAAVPHFKR